MIFQDPMTSLNPFLQDLACRSPRPSSSTRGCGRREARAKAVEMLKLDRHPGRRAPGQRLPAPVLRRHAPARHDRHGPLLQPGDPHRRRADHGARRHDPGADPGAHQGASPRAARHGGHPDHPRPRRRGRDVRLGLRHVRGPHRGAGHAWTICSTTPGIPTPGASCDPSPAWTAGRPASQRLLLDPGPAARASSTCPNAALSIPAARSAMDVCRDRRTRPRRALQGSGSANGAAAGCTRRRARMPG